MTGAFLTFGDAVAIDTGRHTLDSSGFHYIFTLEQLVQIPYCTVVTNNEVQAPHGAVELEKLIPNISRTKNFDVFIFAKTFE